MICAEMLECPRQKLSPQTKIYTEQDFVRAVYNKLVEPITSCNIVYKLFKIVSSNVIFNSI